LKVVSDTSPLIAFNALDKVHILKRLFGEIIITKGVYEELKQEGKEFSLEKWILVKELKNRDVFRALRLSLDYGESEAIAFYLENRMDLLIVDDKEARKVSRGIDINVMGTVGILILAKKKGLLSLIKDEMECLEKKIDFRLSSSIKKRVLQEVGE